MDNYNYPEERTEENDPCPFRLEYNERDAVTYGTCVFFPRRLCKMAEGEGNVHDIANKRGGTSLP